MTAPETNKEYELFLEDIQPCRVHRFDRLRFVWNFVDIDFKIREHIAPLINNVPGPRLMELCKNLQCQPADLRKGLHMWCKVQRRYSEAQNEDIVFDIDYASIRPAPSTAVTINKELKEKVIKFALLYKSKAEAREKIKQSRPEWVTAYEELIRLGEINLPA